MSRRFSSSAAATALLLAGAGLSFGQATDRPPSKTSAAPHASRTLSPLHAFLGIDPVTGEFKAPNANPSAVLRPSPSAPPEQSRPSPGETAANAGKAGASPGDSPLRDLLSQAADTGGIPIGDTPVGDATVDELRAAIEKAVDDRDAHALSATLMKATQTLGYGELGVPGWNYLQAATLALLIYPLGIALGALYAAWAARRQPLLTDRDRRHDTRQLRRRLALAGTTAATIGLVWWAGERNFWWEEPTKLLGAAGGLTVLVLTSALLRFVIRRAASDYSRRTIEDLRFQHAALCEEVKELRRRLQGDGIAETV